MSKLDIDCHVKVDIDEDEINTVKVKKEYTYPEIKEYVLNKYCLKFSSLYITQVNRKFELVEPGNYYKSKKAEGKQKVSICSTKKAEAIEEALQWYNMI